MKRNLSFILIASLLLLLFVSSCSDVFYSGVSGTVYDADNRNQGVAGMNVYGYTSKAERDQAFNSWSNDSDFSDPKCYFYAVTDVNGNWTMPKIVWNTKNSAWGKDYDHTSIYLIYFSQEYGCHKSEAPVEIISSASNQHAVVEYFTREMDTKILTVQFYDGDSTTNVTDELSFTYSYSNGYTEKSEKVSIQNGIFRLAVTSTLDNPVVTFTGIRSTNPWWDTVNERHFTLTAAATNEEVHMTHLATDYTLRVNFKEDGTNSYVTDAMKLKYSYKETATTTREEEITVNNGVFVLNFTSTVDDPVVSISSMSFPGECFDNPASFDVTMDSALKTETKYATRLYYDLGVSGVSGRIIAAKSTVFDPSTHDLVNPLDNLIVKMTCDSGEEDTFVTGRCDYSNPDALMFENAFFGLCNGIKLVPTAEVTLDVYRDPSDLPIIIPSMTFKIKDYYASKDNISIVL